MMHMRVCRCLLSESTFFFFLRRQALFLLLSSGLLSFFWVIPAAAKVAVREGVSSGGVNKQLVDTHTQRSDLFIVFWCFLFFGRGRKVKRSFSRRVPQKRGNTFETLLLLLSLLLFVFAVAVMGISAYRFFSSSWVFCLID
jgi:hypothetical protein